MTADATPAAAQPKSDLLARIMAFARDASFETTPLSEAQLVEVKAAAPSGSDIFVAAIPSRPLGEQVQTAKDLRRFGFEPVPHLAARNFESVGAFEGQLSRLVDEAGVK